MNYHIFVMAGPDTPQAKQALNYVRELLERNCKILQIFFYYEAVMIAKSTTLAMEWIACVPTSIPLKVCQNYIEKYGDFELTSGFKSAGLVDFFAQHWQDQGILVQF